MIKYILILFFLFCAAEANAQIVINPPSATGHAFAAWDYEGTMYDADSPTILVGILHYPDQIYSVFHGILEFPLESLPSESMTTYNFTARLSKIYGSNWEGEAELEICLFDLADEAEDNEITAYDFDQTIGECLAVAYHDASYYEYAEFMEVDVTEVLRRDLFGEGEGDPTTGFILISDGGGVVSFDHKEPRITITVGESDVDADGDGDGDGDSDSDSDEDGFLDEEYTGGGCGCDAVGSGGRGLFGLIWEFLF